MPSVVVVEGLIDWRRGERVCQVSLAQSLSTTQSEEFKFKRSRGTGCTDCIDWFTGSLRSRDPSQCTFSVPKCCQTSPLWAVHCFFSKSNACTYFFKSKILIKFDRQTNRQTDGQTDRKTDRQKNRQTDWQSTGRTQVTFIFARTFTQQRHHWQQ